MVTTILAGILLAIALATGEPSLQSGPEMGGISRPVFVPSPGEADKFNGKTLIVRLYQNCQDAPDEFSRRSILLQGNQAVLEPNEATGTTVVVVAGEDQNDEVVKQAVGDTILARTLTKELRVRLPFPQRADRKDPPWQFKDALDAPMPETTVEIWLSDYGKQRVRLGRVELDSAARLPRRISHGDLRTIYFVVSHPDYGCAEVREPYEPERTVILPLVRRGTIAAERAIHGRVVGPNGAPVAGATVECPHVRTLGEGLINGLDAAHKAITDANGLFSFYLANRKNRDDRGDLIPPKSQYYVRITAPKSLGLLPYAEPIENGRESLVALERGDRVRQLRFEDPNGTIVDSTRLQSISVALRRPGRAVLSLYYDDWKDGLPLVPGVYEARMRQLGTECQFEPVEITRDTPDEVVFKLPAPVTYYGRVVHGITGLPMPGAFVLVMDGTCSKRLSDLTNDQWDELHALADNLPAKDAALISLREIYSFTRLIRTNATGGYAVALEADESFYGFIVFEQDYLAVMYRRHELKTDADHFAEVPTIKLFPAAEVFVETQVDKKHVSIMPKWEIDKSSRPAWIEDLLALDNNRESSLEYDDWLTINARQSIPVPAGVGLKLKLETPYDDEFCPVAIPQTIFLGQGQTTDLGRFTLERAICVQVKVVDSMGRTFEGIPVRTVHVLADGTRGWSVPHNTDEQGIARFYVVPNSAGTFGVSSPSPGSTCKQETLDYTIGGREDAGREFVFQLSDEMLAILLK